MSILLVGMAVSISSQAEQARQPPPPPQMFSHAEAYFLPAWQSTLTREWTCPRAVGRSVARISIESYFDNERMQRFRVSLVELRVNGRPTGQHLLRAVADALAPLYSVGAFVGECRGDELRLLVQGYVQGDRPPTPRLLLLDLTSTK